MSLKQRGALAAAAGLGLSALVAQDAQAQTPTPPQEPPAAPTEAVPGAQKPRAAPPHESPAGHDMLGLSVFSSDGSKIGDVRAVKVGPDGNIAALHVRTGGFLGFGGRTVAIPEGKFARSGPNLRLTFTANEVSSLPEVTEGR